MGEAASRWAGGASGERPCPSPSRVAGQLAGQVVVRAHLASGHAGRPAVPTADAGGHGAEEARG